MISTYISVIASLFIMEVLLSVDNALVNAALAGALPENMRTKAIRIGIILGAVFRFLALFLVAFIIHNVWLKVAGALYLLYLAIDHLGKHIDSAGHTYVAKTTFRGVVSQIVVADIIFSIDNVISAVSFSSNTYLVMFGVFVGIVSMLFITPVLSKVISRYKGMQQAAYVIVGLIGVALLIETLAHVHISEMIKFFVILCILVFTVWFEHSDMIRNMTTPLLRKMQYIIAVPFDIFFAVKSILGVVVRK